MSLKTKSKWKQKIKILNCTVGKNYPTFIIAEAGVNHNGDIKTAKKLIDAAAYIKADAIKFQTFVTHKLVSKKLSPSMFKMLEKYALSKNDFQILRDYARSKKIIFCSTPFDIESCDLLESLKVPFYKIGSGDLDNIPLIQYIAKKNKPIFLSTGMSSTIEINDSLNAISKLNDQVVLMHCTSIYPADYSEANLNLIKTLENQYSIPVGYSDHVVGIEASLGSICFGACVLEKHLTLSKKMPGPDHKSSLEPAEFKSLISNIRNLEKTFGHDLKFVLPREKITKNIARRSIISVNDIPKNSIISKNDVDILRPSGGIPPKFLDKVVGKTAKTHISKGKKLSWNMLK